jgi:DNA-binding XRE family transcriptional regulator
MVAEERKQSRLVSLLNQRGIRHTWMAGQLGVSKWTFHRVETGKQPAPTNWYVRAASILGVSVDEILPDPPDEDLAA